MALSSGVVEVEEACLSLDILKGVSSSSLMFEISEVICRIFDETESVKRY